MQDRLTRRQEIIYILGSRQLTLRQLSDEFLATEEEIAEELRELKESIRPQRRLEQTTPVCHDCGFVFKNRFDRNKVRRPSRCPKCKSEGIEPPRYYIKEQTKNIPKEMREL